jgi:hypothetical protein
MPSTAYASMPSARSSSASRSFAISLTGPGCDSCVAVMIAQPGF